MNSALDTSSIDSQEDELVTLGKHEPGFILKVINSENHLHLNDMDYNVIDQLVQTKTK